MKRSYSGSRLLVLVLVLAGTSATRADLVSHFAFDGDLLDSGAGGNDGTFVGEASPLFVDGFDGTLDGAISFDGVDDYVDVAQNTFLPLSNQPAFTIAMWVRGDVQRDRRIFSEGSSTSNTPLFNLGTHNTGANGTFDFFLRGDAGTIVNHRKSSRTLYDGDWHHLAWVDDNGQVDVYIDGLRDPVDFSYPRGTLTVDTTTIGAILRGAPCCHFAGAIDDVRIFDHALSKAEVHEVIETDACPDVGDSSCTDLVVDGPPDKGIGTYTLTATGADVSGDAPLLYSFSVESDDGSLMEAGPQESNVAEFVLAVGNWTLSATVDDDPFCFDTSAEATCTQELTIDPPPALISHWTFDGTLADAQPAGNDGTFIGEVDIPYVDGFDGTPMGALQFDGVDDYVDVAQNSGLPIYANEAYTVALWVKGPPQPDRRVFSEGSTTSGTPLFNIGTQSLGETGQADMFIRPPGNHIFSDRTAFDDTWHHIAWVDDSGRAVMYIDGVRDAGDFNYERGLLNLNTTSIGGILRATPCCWFQGSIDDVRVYNYAISAEEVSDLVPENPDCVNDADSHCDSLDIVGPEGGGPGVYTAVATGRDTSGDAPLYTFVVTDGDGNFVRQVGPREGNTADFDLFPGSYTVSATVDDFIRCKDAAADATCVAAFEVSAEPQVLISSWSFDGNLLDDVSANDGTFIGEVEPPFVRGFDCTPNGALGFDGVDDFVQVSQNADLPISAKAAFSVTMWVRGEPQGDRRVFSEGSTTNNNPLFNIGTHFQGVNGAVDVFIREDNGNQVMPHRLSTGIAFDGTWHHLAWTDDNGQAVLYIDGQPDATDFTYTRGTSTLDTTTIGGILRATPCCLFAGEIDDVRLFNFALDPDTVASIYGTGAGVCCPAEGDTECRGLDISGPQFGVAGTYTVSARASDGSGDPILYTFTATDSEGAAMTVGPQTENVARFDLTVGTWTLSASVDDDPDCEDRSPNAVCREEVTVSPPGGTAFPGDCDLNGELDITDMICIVTPLFLDASRVFPCGDGSATDAANVTLLDSNGDGQLDLSDAIHLGAFMFGACTAPPCPAPAAGTDCRFIVGCEGVTSCLVP